MARKLSRKVGGRKPSKKVGGRKTKKASKKVNKSDCKSAMGDKNLTALCMACFRKSGRKVKKRVMSLNNRVCKRTKNGRNMIRGKCVVCNGNVVRFV